MTATIPPVRAARDRPQSLGTIECRGSRLEPGSGKAPPVSGAPVKETRRDRPSYGVSALRRPNLAAPILNLAYSGCFDFGKPCRQQPRDRPRSGQESCRGTGRAGGSNSLSPHYPPPDRCLTTARSAFGNLWNKTYGKTAPWEGNCWVWRYELRRVA